MSEAEKLIIDSPSAYRQSQYREYLLYRQDKEMARRIKLPYKPSFLLFLFISILLVTFFFAVLILFFFFPKLFYFLFK
ncbi:hypothetical protein K502DRAFT_345365 [Neoconidiobolus thromboides FSU 785]|nr:hypothetical protein K502DRAFT_345365 [Neoconidiobolus thromboides FSU 785]